MSTPSPPRPGPARPGSTLRVLVLALVAAGVSEVTLYDDGFEIDGPDDVQLVFVRGSLTSEQHVTLAHSKAMGRDGP
ncbi:hypothetical protein [Micromonospora sp. KC723]|uniref:hypothetical protein n=1 Tax=Micromonospora sp. KC723 TaxID=2530381 RepID=UPI00104DDEAA|nr:hypothetical protein [Micromonospora sp. KC723]TDB69659.1 hypothetical protein E1165_27990 [Micromonospora sp. KC723]